MTTPLQKTLTAERVMELEALYCAHNYHPIPAVLDRGEGVYVWDVDGKKYMDFMSAYSAVSFGHANQRLLKAMNEQAGKLAIPSRAFCNTRMGPFAKRLCALTGMERVLPMNTGAEAVETAIKAARRWGYQTKKIPQNKAEIIVAENNFHGRTTTIVGFSTDEEYKEDFGPFDGGFKDIPFGDTGALEAAITPNTCAFLVEPMQGEAGINIPPKGWLKEVQKICKKHNVLLLLDEIQTGMGRTGKNFAFQHEIDKPDGLMLGKALGGGLFPVSAFVASKEVMDVFDPGSHGSTWGGCPLGMAIGLEAMDIMEEEALAKHSAELGAYLLEALRKINSPLIQGIRGAGLWVGVEIDSSKTTARDICERFMAKGFLSKETHETVVRFAPPLVITKEELDMAIAAFRETLEDVAEKRPAAA